MRYNSVMPSLKSLSKLRPPLLPVYEDAYGVLRVVGTRIPLETVLLEFIGGKTPEAIVEQFPALKLEEVYAIVAYYLANRAAMEAYLQRVESEVNQATQTIEARFNNSAFLQSLRSRRQA